MTALRQKNMYNFILLKKKTFKVVASIQGYRLLSHLSHHVMLGILYTHHRLVCESARLSRQVLSSDGRWARVVRTTAVYVYGIVVFLHIYL